MHDYIFYSAIFVTAIYLIISIASLIGSEIHDTVGDFHDSDVHIDNGSENHDGESSFQIINLKNILGFLVGLSWSILIGIDNFKWNFGLSVVFGIFIGVIIVTLQTLLFGLMIKLEQKEVVSNDSAIGKFGTVYLTIPANGLGKVNVEINGSVKTLNAKSIEHLPTGMSVKITGIENGILVVTKC